MAREVIGESISAHVDEYPQSDDCCPKCGAEASHYQKHPELIGGTCGACREVWLPNISFGKPQPVYADQFHIELTDDGGANIHLDA